MYSNPKSIWQDRVAATSPPHHEEGMSMQRVLSPCLLYSASRRLWLENFTFRWWSKDSLNSVAVSCSPSFPQAPPRSGQPIPGQIVNPPLLKLVLIGWLTQQHSAGRVWKQCVHTDGRGISLSEESSHSTETKWYIIGRARRGVAQTNTLRDSQPGAGSCIVNTPGNTKTPKMAKKYSCTPNWSLPYTIWQRTDIDEIIKERIQCLSWKVIPYETYACIFRVWVRPQDQIMLAAPAHSFSGEQLSLQWLLTGTHTSSS